MPELPEVEIMTQNLRRWLSGTIRVEVLDPALAVQDTEFELTRIWRRAKYSVLSHKDGALILHYRMTGKVVPARAKKARLRLYSRSGAVQFEDPRRLGTAIMVPDAAAFFTARRLGPEPFPELQTGAWWAARFAGLRGAIKPALLRQDRVAGLGNIAASEILWRARIHPHRKLPTLSAMQWDAIAQHTHQFLHDVVRAESGQEIVYVTSGKGAPNPFQVYGRAAEPCPRCHVKITRSVQSSRSTFFCIQCQPLS